jgi:PDZ domain-containing protein
MDTNEDGGSAGTPIVTADEVPPDPLQAPGWSPWRWIAIALFLVLSLIIGSSFVRLPYYVEGPGTAPPVAVKIKNGAPVTSPFLLSTVALDGNVYPLRLLAAWLDPNDRVVSRASLTGGENSTQFARVNAQEMDQSKQDAIVVALRRLGYTVPEQGDGVMVTAIQPHAPADGRLQVGDVIVAVDAKPVSLAENLTSVLRARRPGSSIVLTVNGTNGDRRTVTIPTVPCPATVPGCEGLAGSGRAYVGVALATDNDKFAFPFPVDIILDEVGGPSAGLAFTLGVIDALGAHNLAGGHRVAVTGTIDLNGVVGPIGGIALKTVAVERAGADYFLVPKDTGVPGDEGQYSVAEAKARGHHLKVIAVGTLEDALNALRTIGGDLSAIGPATTHPTQ